MLYQCTWAGEQFVVADIQRTKVRSGLIIFSVNEQIGVLLNSIVWFCDGTFKTRPQFFVQVYFIYHALTSNRRRKTYEEIISIILQLAANRKKVLPVKQIILDYEKGWLLVIIVECIKLKLSR